MQPPCCIGSIISSYSVQTSIVNTSDYAEHMNFRTAANTLGRQISSGDMAEAMGVSAYSVRQARLVEGAPGRYRTPPKKWEKAFISLAQARIVELERLVNLLNDKS